MSYMNPDRIRPVMRGKTVWRVVSDDGTSLTLAAQYPLRFTISKEKYSRIINRFKK